MRRFSRWMPPATRTQASLVGRLVGWLVLVAFLATAVAVIVAWPIAVGIFLGAFVVITVVANNARHRRLRRLAAARIGEDIGTFARAFDRRTSSFDPWVVRATWEALEPYVVFPGGRLR